MKKCELNPAPLLLRDFGENPKYRAPRNLIKIASFVQYGLFCLHYNNSEASRALARRLHSAPMNWDASSRSDFTEQFAKSLSQVARTRGWSSQSVLGT